MGLISQAKRRLAQLEKEAQELRLFIQTAERLQGQLSQDHHGGPVAFRSAEIVVRERKPPKSGLVYDTADFVRTYMRQNGDGLKTRELLPVVEAAGIEVGGQNPIATLSARLGASQMFERRGSRLYLIDESENETADSQGK